MTVVAERLRRVTIRLAESTFNITMIGEQRVQWLSMKHKNIKQICNLTIGAKRDNPNQNRVYDTSGIAPCVVDYSGGVICNR